MGYVQRVSEGTTGGRWSNDRAVGLGLVLLAALVHLPDFACGFLADDFPQLAGVTTAGAADLAKSLGYFVRPLPGVEAPLPPEMDPRFWRPLLFLSLGLDFSIFGPRPLGFLAVNVALHAATVGALFGLLRRWDRGLAIAAAALFAAWPGSHEAVPWISARCGPMALLGLIAAAWCVQARRPGLAAACALAALLSKETALIVAPLITVFALARPSGRGAAMLATAPVWAAFALYLNLRYRMLGELGGGYAVHDASIFSPELWAGRLETLRTLLGPVKTHHVGTSAQGVLVAATVLWLAVGLPLTARRQPDLRWPMLAAGLWLAGSLVPMHNLTVFAHVHPDARFLYEPAAPLCVLLAMAGLGIVGLLPRRGVAAGALLLAVAGSTALYRANVADRQVGSAIGRALVRSAQESVRLAPAERHAFIDVPRGYNGVQVGNNTLPWALLPPFSEGAPPGAVEVMFDDAVDPARLEQLSAQMRRGDSLRVWAWDSRSGGFRGISPK